MPSPTPDTVIEIGDDSDKPASFSWPFIRSILNPREIVSPMNKRRLLLWLILGLLALGAAFLLLKADALGALTGFIEADILVIGLLVYGLEPLIALMNIALSSYPAFATEADDEESADIEDQLEASERLETKRQQRLKKNAHLMVAIPCHNTCQTAAGKAALIRVIKSTLEHVPARNIFIADNGKSDRPTDDTEATVKSIDPDINVVYYPYPGKTPAIYKLMVWAHQHRPDLTAMLTMDDDVTMPANFSLKAFFDNPQTIAVIYPILATGSENQLTRWQNFEYKRADCALSAKAFLKAVDKTHGAVSLWRIREGANIYRRHDGRFRGEDWILGLEALAAYNEQGPLTIAMDMACPFSTDVPPTYFGEGPNLWAQRVRSWKVVPYLSPWKFVIKPLLFNWRRPSIAATAFLKLNQAYDTLALFSNIFRYVVIALQATNPKFWAIFAGITVADAALMLVFNYGKLPKHLQSDLKTVLTFPLYKQIDTFMEIFAFLRTVFIELPIKKKATPIQRLIDKGILPSLDSQGLRPHAPTPQPELTVSIATEAGLSERQVEEVIRLYQSLSLHQPQGVAPVARATHSDGRERRPENVQQVSRQSDQWRTSRESDSSSLPQTSDSSGSSHSSGPRSVYGPVSDRDLALRRALRPGMRRHHRPNGQRRFFNSEGRRSDRHRELQPRPDSYKL